MLIAAKEGLHIVNTGSGASGAAIVLD